MSKLTNSVGKSQNHRYPVGPSVNISIFPEENKITVKLLKLIHLAYGRNRGKEQLPYLGGSSLPLFFNAKILEYLYGLETHLLEVSIYVKLRIVTL